MEHSSLEKLLLNSKIACSIHSQQIETEVSKKENHLNITYLNKILAMLRGCG